MKKVGCGICIFYRFGKCTNDREATFNVRVNTIQAVDCNGFRLNLSRDAYGTTKRIRKVKSIHDFERMKPKTIRLQVMGRIITELGAGKDAYLNGNSSGVNWVLLTEVHIIEELSEDEYEEIK